MQTAAKHILEYAESTPEGVVLGAKEFLHLGTRPAIDQALKRLHANGALLRVSAGLYVKPVKTKFGTRAPSPDTVVASINRSLGETVVPHGAAEANALGLTTQVPVRLVYLTSGTSRTLHLGSQALEMKHAKDWQLMPREPETGRVLRALEWLGKKQAPQALASLKQKLPQTQLEELVQVRKALPGWMAQMISHELVAHG